MIESFGTGKEDAPATQLAVRGRFRTSSYLSSGRTMMSSVVQDQLVQWFSYCPWSSPVNRVALPRRGEPGARSPGVTRLCFFVSAMVLI